MKPLKTLTTAALLYAGSLYGQWVNHAPTADEYHKIRFTSANTGYVLNSGGTTTVLYKTTDQGLTWNALPFVAGHFVRDFSFIDDNTGFICADTATLGTRVKLYKTTNGGASWIFVDDNTVANSYSARIHFKDALHGTLTETYNKVWATSDGGLTWTGQDFSYYYFNDIEFPSAMTGYIGTFDGTFNYRGVVLKTTDGGATWSEVFNFSSVPLNYTSISALSFVNDTDGFMATQTHLFKTTNGGLSWDSLPYAYNNNIYLRDIYFTSLTQGYGGDGTGSIYITTDGGLTWTADYAGDSTYLINSVLVNGSNAYATGGGRILKKNIATGLTEQVFVNDTKVYPNPVSNNRIHVVAESANITCATVYNAQGKQVMVHDGFTGGALHLPGLNKGIYTLVLDYDNHAKSTHQLILLE